MFSRIIHSSAAFFSPYNTPSESASDLQVDQQIQKELEQAAERGMVSTRSQDNTPIGDASYPSKQLYPQVVVLEKKRKADDEAKQSPAQAVTKRRRRSAKSNGNAAPSSSASKPGRPRRVASAKFTNGDAAHVIDHHDSDQEPPTQGNRPSPQTPKTTTEQTMDGREDEVIAVAVNNHSHTPNLDDEVSEAKDLLKSSSGSAGRSRKGKIPKKEEKDEDENAGVNGNEADMSARGKKPETSFGTKATHKRFGSEDVEVLGTVLSNGMEAKEGTHKDQLEDEGDSGDEAPETVTASAGFDRARTTALDAAKVATRQEADKKLRRREHDERLRLQAKSAKDLRFKDKPSSKLRVPKRPLPEVLKEDGQKPVEKPESLGELPQGIDGEGQIPNAKPKSSGKTPLPLLLPEEILAAEPVIHAPNPSNSKSKLAISQKRKYLDLETKAPKDIKRGNVNVRVLLNDQSILPPKSSQASKALREYWLTGRGVPRQKPSGGFIRKRL